MESLVAVATIITIGTIIPGPSFLMVARTTLQGSKAAGLCAALGMGLGSLLLAVLGLLGLHVLLTQIPSLYVALKIVGGLYLIFLAVRMWLHAPVINQDKTEALNLSKAYKALFAAFLVQISNPKAAIIYASIFAAFIPQQYDTTYALALLAIVFVIEASWYAIVCFILSTPTSRSAYRRAHRLLNRIAGGVMAVLGLRILFANR